MIVSKIQKKTPECSQRASLIGIKQDVRMCLYFCFAKSEYAWQQSKQIYKPCLEFRPRKNHVKNKQPKNNRILQNYQKMQK